MRCWLLLLFFPLMVALSLLVPAGGRWDADPGNGCASAAAPQADVKACDFGLSDFFKPGQQFSSLIGSAYYVVRGRWEAWGLMAWVVGTSETQVGWTAGHASAGGRLCIRWQGGMACGGV